MINTQYLSELKEPVSAVKFGQKGTDVRRIQEWINLRRFYDTSWSLRISIDGDFGSATDTAVKQFQYHLGLEVDGIVGILTWRELVRPMRDAFDTIPLCNNDDLRNRVVGYARQQERSKPTEINSNLGPWVRAYMNGREGESWCAAFVETVLDQAYSSLGISYKDYFPDPSYYSCDRILQYARINNRLVEKDDLLNGLYVPQKGDLFLLMNPEDSSDATHVGFVIDCAATTITTIEGNACDQTGPANSGEVCRYSRDYKNHLIYIVKLL